MMQSPSPTTEDTDRQGVSGLRRRITARRVNLVLALVIAGLLAISGDRIARRVRYGLTGAVQVEGLTLYLDPRDEVITRMILHDGTWEPSETAVLRSLLRRGDTFIDVGANIGWHTLIAAKAVGPEGHVIAFEPAPVSFEILRHNAEVNGCRNAILVPKALSDKPGSVRLHLSDTNKGHNTILDEPGLKETIDVEAVPLDDYMKDVAREVALVKIDVEGAEGLVLEGMRETLRKHPQMAILMEFYPALIRRSRFDPAAMLRKFLDAGYEVQVIAANSSELSAIHEAQIPKLVALLDEHEGYVNILVKHPS